ncbi:MAG: hypothetical protein KOO63_15905, partial [Bacteroidales bacterium]|nr:hypothetical protein [Candidatus Latescibacterota bacterium]
MMPRLYDPRKYPPVLNRGCNESGIPERDQSEPAPGKSQSNTLFAKKPGPHNKPGPYTSIVYHIRMNINPKRQAMGRYHHIK